MYKLYNAASGSWGGGRKEEVRGTLQSVITFCCQCVVDKGQSWMTAQKSAALNQLIFIYRGREWFLLWIILKILHYTNLLNVLKWALMRCFFFRIPLDLKHNIQPWLVCDVPVLCIWWVVKRKERGKKGCLDLIFLSLFLTQRPSKWAVSGTSQVAVTHLTASLDQAPRQSPLTVIRKWPCFHLVNVEIVHSRGRKKSLKNDTCHWFVS